jgi:hypothetical protein
MEKAVKISVDFIFEITFHFCIFRNQDCKRSNFVMLREGCIDE